MIEIAGLSDREFAERPFGTTLNWVFEFSEIRSGLLAAPEELAPVHVESREVVDGPAPVVLVLDPHGPGDPRWQGGVAAAAGLDAGLLVRRDDVLVGGEAFPLKPSGVEIEDPPSLLEIQLR